MADTGHHRLVELDADLSTPIRAIGGGDPADAPDEAAHLAFPTPATRGHADGGPEQALFNEPNGLALLPAEVAAQVGYDVVVADTVNHRLRGLSLATGEVRTLAGNGVQALIDGERVAAAAKAAEAADPAQEQGAVPADEEGAVVVLGPLEGKPTGVSLSSPWDVVWDEAAGHVVIAMAGTHQLHAYDPVADELSLFAGTGLEGLTDGPAEHSWFAQTSGLAVDAAGTLWAADSETSALRTVTGGAGERTVSTAVGTGLFDFGYVDAPAEQARLQHPLGVSALPDGSVLVADTYNGAIRRFTPAGTDAAGRETEAALSTVARGLAEPSDVLVEVDAEGKAASIVVVETNAHRLERIAVPDEYLTVDEGARQTQRPRTPVVAGEFGLAVGFEAPSGQKLDDRWGDPTQLKVSSSPEELLLDGAGTSTGCLLYTSPSPRD